MGSGHLERRGVNASGGFGLHRVLVSGVTGSVLDDRRVFPHRFGRSGDGGLRRQTHLVVQRLVQLLVRVRAALCVRVLIIRGVAAVCAVHGVFTARRRQVGETVIMDVQVVLCSAVRLRRKEH